MSIRAQSSASVICDGLFGRVTYPLPASVIVPVPKSATVSPSFILGTFCPTVLNPSIIAFASASPVFPAATLIASFAALFSIGAEPGAFALVVWARPKAALYKAAGLGLGELSCCTKDAALPAITVSGLFLSSPAS